MSSAQSAAATQQSAPTTPILPDDMDLEEVMRVMDVASTLRREQEIVDREFKLDETKDLLREKLRNTAELTGESLTSEQIEAAVNWYYDNLHEYKEPGKGLNWYLAHLYVARTKIFSILAPILIALTAIWAFWFSPFAPFSATNRNAAELQTIDTDIQKRLKSITSIAQSDEAKNEAQQLAAEAKAFLQNKELDGLNKTHLRLETIDSRLQEEFTLTVVSGEGKRSAIRRDFDGNVSGFYLIVQARDKNGQVIKRNIHNIEQDKMKLVDTWGEKIPEAVYNRLRQDKKEDGILNETTFGQKQRGYLNVEVIMRGPNNLPLQRSGQIIEW